jgi:hypothetical protein
MPDAPSAATLRAVAAHNADLDTRWTAIRDLAPPEEVTRRGVYYAASVAHAVLPPALVQIVVDAHPEVGPTKKDHLWLFLPESAPDTHNLVMRVAPRDKSYFDLYRKQRDMVPERIATPERLAVRPTSYMYGALARTYSFHWPCLLTSWTDGRWVYVRRTFTPEVWASIEPRMRAYVSRHPDLFGLR